MTVSAHADWHGHGHGGFGGGYHNEWHGGGYGGIPGGFLGGIVGGVIGSIFRPQEVIVEPPQPYHDPQWYTDCAMRYHSFNPQTGDYLGFDGRYHPCL